MKEDTRRFLERLNAQNQKIAEQDDQNLHVEIDVDQFRLQRDQERREKYGQLRARPKPGKRPTSARRVFPYVDPS